jgi:hypothetical protein
MRFFMAAAVARRSVAKTSVACLLVTASAACGVACSSGEADATRDVAGEDAGAASSADASVVIPGRPSAADAGDPGTDAAATIVPDASSDAPSVDASTPDAAPSAIDASTPDSGAPADSGVVVPSGPGHVAYRLPDGHWRTIAATVGARAFDVSGALDAISAGKDNGASLGVDGAWIALDTTRAGCAGGDCLALASSSGSQLSLVRTGGMETQVHARPAVGPGGTTVVYPVSTSQLRSDLFASRNVGGVWSAPQILTASSAYPSHHDVAFSFDGAKVVFDCAPSDYQAPGGAICEASVDGSAFRKVIGSADLPGATAANEVHHPAYAPDGSVVFEADWNGSEEIWRLPAGGNTPTRISPVDETDDNSPCVLPDGRIVSLWLGRAGNPTNLHELKVMNADGTGTAMLVTGVDIVDVGTSCGR